MENHFDLNDLEFEQQFASRVLAPRLFNHEAHLRLAWIHISKYGIDKAVENIRTQLQNFVGINGAADKYSETVTIAAVRAVDHFMRKSTTNNFKDFIMENHRLKFQFKELLSFLIAPIFFFRKRRKKSTSSQSYCPLIRDDHAATLTVS